MTFSPENTGLTDTTMLSVSVPTTSQLGTASFLVGATCSNSEATGALPGPGSWTFGVVTTDIVDETVSPPEDITAHTGYFEDQVGNEESLQVQIAPSDAQPYLTDPTWTIPYETFDPTASYINGYTQGRTSSSMDTSVNLNSTTLHFFPIVPFPVATASGQLTFTGDSGSAGTAFNASVNYKIDTPTVSILASSGHVQLGSGPGEAHPILIAGPTNENGGAPGISYSATFTSPSSKVEGMVGMLQLVSAQIYFAGPPGGATSLGTISTAWYDLDGDVPYGQLNDGVTGTEEPVLSPNSTTDFETTDEPDIPMFPCTDFNQMYEYFQDYFYFVPTPKTGWSSIRTTLATNNWEFQAFGARIDDDTTNVSDLVSDWGIGRWEDVTSAGVSGSQLLPQWSNNATDEFNEGTLPPCP
jgi:hypothetical protein